ncbi:DUF4097 family beta strand repeat protein [Candidatus Dependentiae bacterium]|nr:DUF4097 family beta strand repeat protein [Candidatus Dependentiae bacterium]
MHFNLLRITLILSTIPIQTKISTLKIPTKISNFFSKSKEKIFHNEFTHISNIELTNLYGNISVETWKQPCIMIEQRKNGTVEFMKNSNMITNVDGQTLTAHSHIQNNYRGNFNIRILLPEHISLKLKTGHGCITINGHNGPIDLVTNHGNISIINGNNTVIAQTMHGAIMVQRKVIKDDHCLNLQSDYGNITLMIPQELESELEAHTVNGKIISDLFVTLQSQTVQLNEQTFKNMRQHVQGWIGQYQCKENSPTILMKTHNGIISILPYSNKKFKK